MNLIKCYTQQTLFFQKYVVLGSPLPGHYVAAGTGTIKLAAFYILWCLNLYNICQNHGKQKKSMPSHQPMIFNKFQLSLWNAYSEWRLYQTHGVFCDFVRQTWKQGCHLRGSGRWVCCFLHFENAKIWKKMVWFQ